MHKKIMAFASGAIVVVTSYCMKKFNQHDLTNIKDVIAIEATNEIETNKAGTSNSETTIMFFTKENNDCRSHMHSMTNCDKEDCPIKYIRIIKDHIDSATKSLDICVYIITASVLKRAIQCANRRGVKVRVITDLSQLVNTQRANNFSFMADILLRTPHTNYLMHNKFAVIDGRILITGSANWTHSAFFGNYENVMLITDAKLVKRYEEEFIKLWAYSDTDCPQIAEQIREKVAPLLQIPQSIENVKNVNGHGSARTYGSR